MLTLKKFEKMSKQKLLDASIKHITKTGVPSIENGNCKYGGTGCGAACFLTKKGRIEADSKKNAGWTMLACNGLVSAHEKDFVQELQSCHDNAAAAYSFSSFMPAWKNNIRKLALKMNLSTKLLDDLP